MATLDSRVDAYIKNAEPFAQPVLHHLRNVVHRACPEVEENIKWGMPYFEYKGLLCNMAAFKKHCAFGFWKAALMKDASMLIENNGKAMGHSGKITSLADLPPNNALIARIKEAMKLNEEGIELPAKSPKKEEPLIPEILHKSLFGKRKAYQSFQALSASHKREYINWINDAKTAETKLKRSEKVVDMVLKKT